MVIRDGTGEGATDYRDRIDVPDEHKFVGFDAYSNVIPLVDVVILATPPGFRPIHFDAAIEAGKHVFCEKPMALTVADTERMVAAAESAGRRPPPWTIS